jgi:hypothetical protein
MDTDTGLPRRLPEWDPNVEEQELTIKERNVMTVKVNMNNDILVKNGKMNRVIDLSELKDIAKEFIANPNDDVNLPVIEPYDIEGYGTVNTTIKHVIALDTDLSANYSVYFKVQHELSLAYTELRDAWARRYLGKPLSECDPKTEEPIARAVYASKISETNPKEYGTEQ